MIDKNIKNQKIKKELLEMINMGKKQHSIHNRTRNTTTKRRN
jgi:hypothetical protein